MICDARWMLGWYDMYARCMLGFGWYAMIDVCWGFEINDTLIA